MCNSKNFGDEQEIHILSCKSRIFKPGVGQWTSFAEFLQCLSDQHISRDRIQYTILISNIDQWDQVRTYPQSRLELRPVCILLAIAIRIYTIWRVVRMGFLRALRYEKSRWLGILYFTKLKQTLYNNARLKSFICLTVHWGLLSSYLLIIFIVLGSVFLSLLEVFLKW